MGLSPIETLTLTLAVVVYLLCSLPPSSPENLYSLVYKGCATSRGGVGASPQAIAALSTSLLSQSSSSKFYKTTVAGQSISGLFQCRGDLSPSDCSSCVSQALPSWSAQCGPSTPAARVQLVGCYALYQVSGFPQVSGTQMLFKTCSSSSAAGSGDFEVRRGTALSALQNGISSGSGFYATSFGGVYAMAQCEGDLSSGDCGECVSQAVQKVEVECGGAASGQVYLDKCYISYSYYPNGAPRGGGGGGQQTGKTVAIVVGGAAGLGFLVICLLFANSLRGKNDDY